MANIPTDDRPDVSMNVPIEVRTHELKQLKSKTAGVVDSLQQADMSEAASEVQRLRDEHISGVDATYPDGESFAAYVSMPAEDWRLTIRYLNRSRRSDGLHTHWLQSKLVSRIEQRIEALDD